jgi:hypothetical protein
MIRGTSQRTRRSTCLRGVSLLAVTRRRITYLAAANIVAIVTGCSSSGGPESAPASTPISTHLSSAVVSSATPTVSPHTSTAEAAPSTSTRASASGYIAVCTLVDNFTLTLDYYDATTGEHSGNKPNLTYQSDGFSPTGKGGENCDSLSFNADLTQVAGFDTTNSVPASMNLASGTVTDKVAPSASGGFDATAKTTYYGQTFNPITGDFWYLQQIPKSGLELVGPAGVRTYPGAARTLSGASDKSVIFFWPQHGNVPYVETGDLLEPNDKIQTDYPFGQVPPGAYDQRLDPSKLPASNYSFGDIWFSDDHTSAAFVAESPSPDETLMLYTVSANGGEPTQLGADLDLPLPQYNEGADEPQVVRYAGH